MHNIFSVLFICVIYISYVVLYKFKIMMTRRNFMCDPKKWNKLESISYKESVRQGKSISTSELIREAIDDLIDKKSKKC